MIETATLVSLATDLRKAVETGGITHQSASEFLHSYLKHEETRSCGSRMDAFAFSQAITARQFYARRHPAKPDNWGPLTRPIAEMRLTARVLGRLSYGTFL